MVKNHCRTQDLGEKKTMKKQVLYALLFLYTTASHPRILTQTPAVNDLKQFLKLSQHCYASAHATSDQHAFDTFKKINSFYLQNRDTFKNLNTIDEQTAQALASQCTQLLTQSIAENTKSTGASFDSQLPLREAITLFTRTTPQLLTPRTTSAFFGRVILLSLIELSTFLIEGTIQPDAPPTPKALDANGKPIKTMPQFADRLNDAKNIPILSSYFTKLIGLNIAKALSIGAVNEYTQKGISPYIHRIAENLIPKIVAITVAGILEYNEKNKLNSSFWRRSGIKIASPLVLGKAFVSKSHALYKPLLLLSYIFPFFSGSSGEVMLASGDYSLNALKNILMDGTASAVIFSGIPAAVEKALPKKNMTLNPNHRRKAIRNSIRAFFDKLFLLWNKQVFN